MECCWGNTKNRPAVISKLEKRWKALELHSARAISWCHITIELLDMLCNTLSHTLSNLIWHVYNKMIQDVDMSTCWWRDVGSDRVFFQSATSTTSCDPARQSFLHLQRWRWATEDHGDMINDIRDNCLNDCIWYFRDMYIGKYLKWYIII